MQYTQGAWAPLMLGSIVMLFMLFWTWAKVPELAHVLALHQLTFRLATGGPVRRRKKAKPPSLHCRG